MKKVNLSKCVAIFALGFSLTANSWAFSADQAVDECSKELLLAYFPEPFVTETLKKFNVSQDQWKTIQSELTAKDKEVIKLVEQKASQMNPNPLKDPQARQEAVKLFRETLLQVFSDVLKAHGITDDKQIQAMLDDVQQQKAQRFAKCMKKQTSQTSANSAADDEDDDNDDEEDDDDSDDNDDEDSKKSSTSGNATTSSSQAK